MRELKLDSKTVLITGADSGIGKAVALLFAEEGADIAIIYHSDEKNAREAKSEIENLGRKCSVFKGDINDYEFCEEVTSKVISEFGKIDILVNNAGIQFPSKSIEELEEENIRTTFNSNIIGMILLTKVVFPYLKEGVPLLIRLRQRRIRDILNCWIIRQRKVLLFLLQDLWHCRQNLKESV
jgi:NAD(P)-dependent dehydrogenase (short-subunit alcohol dehydrogenase family)